jgi:DNA-binding transcriptional LysR family regulator
MTIDRLDAMRTFVTIVDAGSFSAAAKRLGVSVPAISRRLSGFEERLGTPLLERTTRSLECTEFGRAFYDRTARILAEIDEVELELAGMRVTPAGLLRVAAQADFGRTFVAPVIPEFLKRYPLVRVDLSLVRHSQHAASSADAVVQSEPSPALPANMAQRMLGSYRHMLCASPDYLRRAGVPQCPGDLAAHDCIVESSQEPTTVWRFKDGQREVEQSIEGRLVCDDTDAVLSAALAGSGVARAPSFQLREHVRAQRLTVLLEAYEPPQTPMQVSYPKQGPAVSRASAFVQFLAGAVPQERLGL